MKLKGIKLLFILLSINLLSFAQSTNRVDLTFGGVFGLGQNNEKGLTLKLDYNITNNFSVGLTSRLLYQSYGSEYNNIYQYDTVQNSPLKIIDYSNIVTKVEIFDLQLGARFKYNFFTNNSFSPYLASTIGYQTRINEVSSKFDEPYKNSINNFLNYLPDNTGIFLNAEVGILHKLNSRLSVFASASKILFSPDLVTVNDADFKIYRDDTNFNFKNNSIAYKTYKPYHFEIGLIYRIY